MSVYLIATIEVKAAGFGQFCEALGEIVAIVEAVGWKLSSAYVLRTGQLNTVIDVWKLHDFNHMDVGMGALAKDPRFPHLRAILHDTIVKEMLCFADKLTYPGVKSA